MTPGLRPAVLIALALFIGGTKLAQAQDRTVKLTVNVLSDNKPVPGAKVTLAPSAGPVVTTETAVDGSATADVSVGKSGWFSSDATIKITAQKDSYTGTDTVNVRGKGFKSGTSMEVIRTIALSPPPAPLTATSTTRFTVTVVDENGGPVSGASVSLSRDVWGPDSVLYDNRMETGSDGVASTDIQIKGDSRSFGEGWLYSPTFDVEIRKDDLSGKVRFQIVGGKTSQGYRYPQYIARRVIVRNFEHGQAKQKATINVTVGVEDDKHNAVEGARVLITDPGLGAATGRFVGVTGADGRATIPFWWTTSGEVNFGVHVSRTGYRDKETFITLNEHQVGTTVSSGTITLEKLNPGEEGVTVNVKVLNKKNGRGVVEANVVLDGGGGAYYSEETNGQGDVTFNVTQTGTFAVRITHSTLLPFSDEIRLVADDKNKQRNFIFKAEGKDKEEQGEDTLEVTVLGKESSDDKAATVPVAGAEVRSGAIVGTTGSDGVVPLHGAFQEKTDLTVRADGYTTQVKKLTFKNYYKKQLQGLLPNVAKSLIADEWKTRIVLEPELTNQSAIRLSIDVKDSKGNGIPNAKLDFSAADGTYLPLKDLGSNTRTDSTGNFLFQSSKLEEQDVATLRKGLVVSVTAGGYQSIQNRSIPADMLQPSTKTTPFLIEMERDWSELRKAIDDLEPRVFAWNNEKATLSQDLVGLTKLKAEVTQIAQKAAAISDEIEQAKLPAVYGPSVANIRCREVDRLKAAIEGYSKDANSKEQELRKVLDQAKAMAATCSKAWEAEAIGKLYEEAVRLTAAIGVLEKKAVKDANSLKEFAKAQTEFKKKIPDLETKVSALVADASKAAEVVARAVKAAATVQTVNNTLQKSYATLWGELANLKQTYGLDKPVEPVPEDLLKRVDAMQQLLSKVRTDVFSSSTGLGTLHEIQEAAAELKDKKEAAEALLSRYKNAKGLCDIESMDDTVEDIGAIVTGATLELGAAANSVSVCVAKANEAKDEVTVPDISRAGDDPAALLAAAAPFTGTIVATNKTPPAGTKKLFSNQLPLAGTKANPKTQPIQIFIYQSVAEAAQSPSPSAQGDLITVPDVSGFNDPDAMLAAAGPDMVGMIIATNKTPSKGSTKLFDHQDPLAGTKSERGKPLKIFIYQSLADTTTVASASPTATPATAVKGKMPDLGKLTIDQAVARLPSNMRMGGVEVGKKPKNTEIPLTIYSQFPEPNTDIDTSRIVVVTVKIFGEAASDEGSPSPAEDTASPPAVADSTSPSPADDTASPPPVADDASPSPAEDNASPPPVADNASPIPAEDNTGSGSGDWVGTWGENGPNGLKISRAGSGYILVGSLTDNKPVPGKEQGGSLVFSWELDLRDVVGILGQAEKIGKKEDSTMSAKYIFTHNGDKLDMVMEMTEPGGKVTRNSIPSIPRVGN